MCNATDNLLLFNYKTALQCFTTQSQSQAVACGYCLVIHIFLSDQAGPFFALNRESMAKYFCSASPFLARLRVDKWESSSIENKKREKFLKICYFSIYLALKCQLLQFTPASLFKECEMVLLVFDCITPKELFFKSSN